MNPDAPATAVKRAARAALYSSPSRRLLRRNRPLSVAVMRGVLAIDRERRNTGWSDQARYCYGVWLRHLVSARSHDLCTDPRSVIELGPGDSLGIGLCGVLCGADHLVSLDAYPYADVPRTLAVLDGLVGLLRGRAAIPDAVEYPDVRPYLESWAFPGETLSADRLERALDPSRIESVRAAISAGMDGTDHGAITIEYIAPWRDTTVVAPNSADVLISQAVMEHVRDVTLVYEGARRWLRDGGHLSFQIDFRCHGTSADWNGQWMYSDRQWKLLENDRVYRWINRQPLSAHLRECDRHALALKTPLTMTSEQGIQRRDLAARWKHLSDDDLRTQSALVLAAKAPAS